MYSKNKNFQNVQKKYTKAFTLIEMLIVVVIIGILAAALIPRLQNAQQRTRDVIRKKDIKTAADALAVYWVDNHNFPCPNPSTDPNRGDTQACAETTFDTNAHLSGGILSLLVPAYISKAFDDPIAGGKIDHHYGYVLYSTGTRYFIAGYIYPTCVKKTTNTVCNLSNIPAGIVQLRYIPENPSTSDRFRACPDGRPFDPIGLVSNVGHPENRFRGVWVFEDKVMAIGDKNQQYLTP